MELQIEGKKLVKVLEQIKQYPDQQVNALQNMIGTRNKMIIENICNELLVKQIPLQSLTYDEIKKLPLKQIKYIKKQLQYPQQSHIQIMGQIENQTKSITNLIQSVHNQIKQRLHKRHFYLKSAKSKMVQIKYRPTIQLFKLQGPKKLIYSQQGIRLLAIRFDQVYVSNLQGYIKIFNLKNYNTIQTLTGHQRAVTKLTFMGKYLSTCSYDCSIRIWQKKGACIRVLHHPGFVNDFVVFFNQLIVSACQDQFLYLWDTHKILRSQKSFEFKLQSQCYCLVQCGIRKLAAGLSNNQILIIKNQNRQLFILKKLKEHNKPVTSLVYHQQSIYSSSWDGSVWQWTSQGLPVKQLVQKNQKVIKKLYLFDGILIVIGQDKIILVDLLKGDIKIINSTGKYINNVFIKQKYMFICDNQSIYSILCTK